MTKQFFPKFLLALLACTLLAISGCSDKDREQSSTAKTGTIVIKFGDEVTYPDTATKYMAKVYNEAEIEVAASDEYPIGDTNILTKPDAQVTNQIGASELRDIVIEDVPATATSLEVLWMTDNGTVVGRNPASINNLPCEVNINTPAITELSDLELTVTSAYPMDLKKVDVVLVYSSDVAINRSLTVEDATFDKTTGTCTAVAEGLSGKDVVVSSVTLTNPANNIPFEWLDYESAQVPVDGKLSLDVTANEFANGKFEASKTMLIANPRQFRNIENYLDGDYKQIDDVDFGGSCGIVIDDNGNVTEVDKTARYYNCGDAGCTGYAPMAVDGDSPFTGTYDGDEYMIANVFCNRVGEYYTALFGVGENCTFKNVNIDESCRIKSTDANVTASLIGWVYGTKGSVMENCKSAAKIFAANVDATADLVGGLIAGCWLPDGGNVVSITNCQFSGTIKAPDSQMVGGIVGGIVDTLYSKGSITGCSNSGSIVGAANVGGITGYAMRCGLADNAFSFANCSNSGDLKAIKTSCGGIIGRTGGDCYLSYDSCRNSGTVKSKTIASGICGLAGEPAAAEQAISFRNCEVAGKIMVTGDAEAYAGGLLGFVDNGINTLVVEAANISCTVDYETNATYVGGVFGRLNGKTAEQLIPILQGKVTVTDACAASIGDSKENHIGTYCGSPYIATL